MEAEFSKVNFKKVYKILKIKFQIYKYNQEK